MRIMISIILDAFPEESLTQILNIDHNLPEKEHIPKKKKKNLELFESTFCIPKKTYLLCGRRPWMPALTTA